MQDINIEAMMEEIDMQKEPVMGTAMRSCKLFEEVIPIDRLVPILAKYIPNFETYINGTNTPNNTPILASISTISV